MENGADARRGIWPHRDATSALRFAIERSYDEIVAIIHQEESRRRGLDQAAPAYETNRGLEEAMWSGDQERVIALLESGSDACPAAPPGWLDGAAFARQGCCRNALWHGSLSTARR